MPSSKSINLLQNWLHDALIIHLSPTLLTFQSLKIYDEKVHIGVGCLFLGGVIMHLDFRIKIVFLWLIVLWTNMIQFDVFVCLLSPWCSFLSTWLNNVAWTLIFQFLLFASAAFYFDTILYNDMHFIVMTFYAFNGLFIT